MSHLIDHDAPTDCDLPIVLPVRGRGRLTAGVSTTRGGVIIRIDDDARPSFWAEVELSEAALVALLDQVRRRQQ